MTLNEIQGMSLGDATQNASSAADFEQEFRRTIKYGNKSQICRAILQDFCTDCSIQGFKFFCERKRHWTERVFWVISFVIATCFSCYMIQDLYEKWNDTPVIVSLNEKATPVWKIPFPAVTICPEVKISAKIMNITQTFHEIGKNNGSVGNFSQEKMNQIITLTHICKRQTFKRFGVGKNTTDATIIRVLNDISLKLNDSINYCDWRDKHVNCLDLFRTILTEDGICFTFNSLNSREIYSENIAPELLSVTGQPDATHWNMEHGYDDSHGRKLSLKSYPRRILGTGSKNGLDAMLYLDPNDLDYLCQGAVQGFKVVLHSPSEVPQPSQNFFRVPLGQEVLVSVKPNVLETSEKLQTYEWNRRLCYMNGEKTLDFFKVYTERHCELECTSNYMKKKCGCVFFSYPRANNTPMCGVNKLDCVAAIEEEMVEHTFFEGLKGVDNTEQSCNCLPSCTSINYDVEISSAKFDSDKLIRALDLPIIRHENYIDFNKTVYGSLHIYFKEKQFITSRRSELYSKIDFYASCGGLLSLFIGVTALSFVEIIYYFTLRLVWTLRMYRNGNNKDVPNGSINLASTKSF